eukprot:6206768-Pleurochrysis_carterae.AAC.1
MYRRKKLPLTQPPPAPSNACRRRSGASRAEHGRLRSHRQARAAHRQPVSAWPVPHVRRAQSIPSVYFSTQRSQACARPRDVTVASGCQHQL